jgi:hypothetical protein
MDIHLVHIPLHFTDAVNSHHTSTAYLSTADQLTPNHQTGPTARQPAPLAKILQVFNQYVLSQKLSLPKKGFFSKSG